MAKMKAKASKAKDPKMTSPASTGGMTAAQKKLPAGLQKAIAAKKGK